MNSFFTYCPNCKSSHLVFSEKTKISCSDCGFVYFHNTAGAVAVILQKDDKILLTIRNKEPQKGYLDLAGGFIDPEESAEYSCVRELKEELGISINESKLQYLASLPNTYLYKGILYNTIDLFFLYRDDSLDVTGFDCSELSGFVWKGLSEINLEEIAFESQKQILSLLQDKNIGI